MKARGTKRIETPVLVVGGGPSGMTAALCLAASGVPSVIVERRQNLARHPKAHEISGRTIEILTSLGIALDDLRREASPHEDASRIMFCRTLNEEIGRIELSDAATAEKYRMHYATPSPYLNLSQTELEKILRRRVLAQKRIRLLAGAEWQNLVQYADGVCSQVNLAGAAMEIHSRYVLACDGAGGGVRKALGITMAGPEKIQDFVNAYFTDDLRSQLKTRAKLFFTFKPDAAGTFIAHEASRRWVYHVPVMTPHEKIEDYTAQVLQRRIASALGDPEFKANIESISHWRMTAQVAETFKAGRVFLIGDAAHRFPPTGGLGLNSGVADAHNLAWKMAAVLSGEAAPTLLDTYESERKAVVTINCDESRRNFFNLFAIPRALGLNAALLPRLMWFMALKPVRWFGDRFRRRLLGFFFWLADQRLRRSMRNPRTAAKVREVIAAQRDHFDRIGLDLGFVYSDGALVGKAGERKFSSVADYRPQFAAGARLPAFAWRHGKGVRTAFAALGYDRFTLFTAEKNLARRHQGGFPTKLKIVPLPRQITLAGRDLPWTQSILVRPDGHIAACPTGAELSTIFARLGYRVTPSIKRRLVS